MTEAVSCSCLAALGVCVLIAILLIKIKFCKHKNKSNLVLIPLELCNYDVFILCADEDDKMVKECIEEPLMEDGYKVLKKNTAPDIFLAGEDIISCLDKVLKICARVIIFCSTNYNYHRCDNDKREMDYFKDMSGSCDRRIIPIITDGNGAMDFKEFSQMRITSFELLNDSKARKIFINKLKRDINTNNFIITRRK